MSKRSPSFIAFLQATAISIYCGFVGYIMWQGESIFGHVNNFLGPVLFLVLFVVSAVICSLLYFWYPFTIFWEKKDLGFALRTVFLTTMWLIIYLVLIILGLYLS